MSKNKLENLRLKLSTLDKQIVQELAHRMEIVLEIGKEKRRQSLPVFDPAREEFVLSYVKEEALKNKLDPSLVQVLYKKIMQFSRKLQKHGRDTRN